MDFIDVVTSWPLPATLVSILLGGFLICQLIGEIIELFGKTSPIFFKVRKAISNKIEDIKNKKASRDTLLANMQNTLNQVNEKMPQLESKYTEAIEVIKEFNKHYDPESINKRDKWMLTVNSDLKWAHDRAKTYDASVGELKELAIEEIVNLENLNDPSIRKSIFEFMNGAVYVLDGGINGANPTTYTIESSDITLIRPSKEGYTFLGWQKIEEGALETISTKLAQDYYQRDEYPRIYSKC